jgi:hypothetical protein
MVFIEGKHDRKGEQDDRMLAGDFKILREKAELFICH